MHRLIVASLAAAGLSVGFGTAASAADLGTGPAPVYTKAPMAVPFSWTGFYLGGHLGGVWGKDNVTDLDGYNNHLTTEFKPSGLIGGGQIGYNFQVAPSIVLGLEGDIGYMKLGFSGPLVGSPAGDTVATATSGLYGDITGRAGFLVMPTLLAYAKGGVAFYDPKFQVTDSCNTFPCGGALINGRETGTATGFTVGGGLEYAIGRNWTVKAEYQHFDFGSQTETSLSPGGAPFRFSSGKLTADSASVGVNYLFGH